MRRLARYTALSLLLLAAQPTGAWGDHTEAQGARQQVAAGAGSIQQFGTYVRVNSRGANDGSGGAGTFSVSQSFFRLPLDFNGRVTCLLVVGNKAIVGGEVTENRPVAAGGSLPNPAVGTGVLIDIRDNGGSRLRDSVNFTFRPAPPTVCPAINSFQFRLTSGNFVVQGADPASASSSSVQAAQDTSGGAAYPGRD